MLKKIIWGCFAALFLYFGSFLVYPNVEKLKKENPVKTAFMEYREKEWQREGKKHKNQAPVGSPVADLALSDQGRDYRRRR